MTQFLERSPEAFAAAWLLGDDFDGTAANTFASSPNHIGVTEAYTIAVDSVFGAATLRQYCESGGLCNRAPREVVQSLAPDATTVETQELCDKLVAAKLAVLLDEIGPTWPQPIEGYLPLRKRVQRANEQGQRVDEAIISSGHEPFIRKTYDAWGEPAPDIIIASEILEQATDFTPDQLIKPSAGLMVVARNLWRTIYGVGFTTTGEQHRMIYVGDDREKDGCLASNSGIPFVHISGETPAESWRTVGDTLGLPA